MAYPENKPELFRQVGDVMYFVVEYFIPKNIAFKILGVVAASLSFASLGAGIGMTSVLIYSLGSSTDPYIELTLELASWIRKNGVYKPKFFFFDME